ncbi:MAG: DUF3592 domain-containing protein [Akkermansia sp.]|nr:DUF3592 domain-containing protein [Akkermansia sp.]
MYRKLFHLLAGRRYFRLFLLAGLLMLFRGGQGLYEGIVYVRHTAAVPGVVVDVRQHPFESMTAALRGGDYRAETAYQPIVRFTLPCGVTVTRLLPDDDAQDYREGETVFVRTYEADPTGARLNKAKFLWGEGAALALGGMALMLLGRLLYGRPFFRRTPRRPAATQAAPARREERPAPAPAPREQRAPRKREQQGQLDLGLDAPPAKPKRKRKSPAAEGAAPRKRKKKEA